MSLLTIGIKENQQFNLVTKIKLTNQITALTTLIGVVYTIILYTLFGPLAIFPLGCLITSLLIFALNHFGVYNLARFLSSFQMLLFTTLFHAHAIQEGELVITSLYLSQFSMIIFPLILFDLDEKAGLTTSLMICCALVFGQQLLNHWLIDESADSNLYRDGFLSPLTYFFAGLMLIAGGMVIKSSKSN